MLSKNQKQILWPRIWILEALSKSVSILGNTAIEKMPSTDGENPAHSVTTVENASLVQIS